MKALKISSFAVVAVSIGAILAGCSSDPGRDVDFEDVSEDDLSAYDQSPITDEDIADPSLADDGAYLSEDQSDDANGLDVAAVTQTAQGAINWFRNRSGSTAHEGYCERAARMSWNRQTRHPSAIAHWRSSDGTRRSGRAPKGAFVFWNTSKYGHVGIADGVGGAWSTSVNRRIGHIRTTGYFRNYLGWKPGNSN